jgi:hypothetical protein
MAQSKPTITPENMTEWLASTGFLFPRTIVELARFKKLHNEIYQEELPADGFDPDIILGIKFRTKEIRFDLQAGETEPGFRMAARKGDANLQLPDDILDKIRKNQEKKKHDSGSQEEKTE